MDFVGCVSSCTQLSSLIQSPRAAGLPGGSEAQRLVYGVAIVDSALLASQVQSVHQKSSFFITFLIPLLTSAVAFPDPAVTFPFFFNISSHKEVSLALLTSFWFYLSLKLFSDCSSSQYFPGLQSRITYSSCGNHRLIDLHSIAKAA